ncbi:hypothetical protein DR100_01800 [Mycoplasma hyopneumoniae]|nr:hypothetical protein [Mesomycoplasma hyopneumoniae]
MPKDKNIMIIKNISLKYSINKRFFSEKATKIFNSRIELFIFNFKIWLDFFALLAFIFLIISSILYLLKDSVEPKLIIKTF